MNITSTHVSSFCYWTKGHLKVPVLNLLCMLKMHNATFIET